jgi:LPS-assembly protein
MSNLCDFITEFGLSLTMNRFPLNPVALALLCLTSPSAQAALNLPSLEVDPALLRPAAADGNAPASEPQAPPASDTASPPEGAAAPAQPSSLGVGTPAGNGSEEEQTGPPLELKPNQSLTLTPPKDESTPIFIRAMRIQGHQDREVEAFDDVELRKWGEIILADHLVYDKPKDELFAEGHVRIDQAGNIAEGPELRLQLKSNEGYMETPVFQLVEQTPPGRGDASKLLFEGEKKYRLKDVRYTTCPTGVEDWFLHADDLAIDRVTQVATGKNAYVEFKNVPILYSPWLDFSLDRRRKSGFLAPSLGTTGRNGFTFSLPYYWNIAPNMDATVTPRFMAKRGFQLLNEFRYLEPTYSGEVNLDVLPNDQVTNTNRDFFALAHRQNFGNGWAGNLNVMRASDDAYFRDLSTNISATSLAFLPREANLTYSGNGWGLLSRLQSFQTLQDPLAPVTPPYKRLPQFVLNGARADFNGTGATVAVTSEFVRFQHPTEVTGDRTMIYPTVSLPMRTVYGYLTPKIGVHATNYTLDPASTGLTDSTALARIAPFADTTRTLPILSVDSGLVFERDMKFRGQAFLQTLEPRLYYLYVPNRDQSQIPVFDSGEAGVSFAQLFAENRFNGYDRIGDANQVTAAVTSRVLDAEGGERLRAAIGQRYSFRNQQVTLTAPASTRRYSDILATLGGRITRQWQLDTLWQYSPGDRNFASTTVSARYQPAIGKTLSVAYRFTQDPSTRIASLRQFDVSGQWPLWGRLYGLGRVSYSTLESRLVEGLAGLEYNGGCWAARAVVHTLAIATDQTTNAIFLQLELNGLGQIGTNPLDVLRRNIYGYTKTSEIPNDISPAEPRSFY